MTDRNEISDDSDVEDLQDIQLIRLYYATRRPHMTRIHNSAVSGINWVNDILTGHADRCQRNFRMKRLCFMSLCERLESLGLQTGLHVTVREMVAIFLYTIAFSMPVRQVAERFQRSINTVSSYFHSVLEYVLLLSMEIIRPIVSQFNRIAEEIRSSPRYYPYFKNCIGAIDGTHVMAHVPQADMQRFVGRKGLPTQNIMAVCAFDLTFTFVRAGWEGSAHDARIFREVINTPTLNFPYPPNGQYYLVDSGYPLVEGYLPPYRNVRYHIPDFNDTQNEPKTENEVFNYYHSSLRMAIERTFGIWKKKFAILRNMPTYPYNVQIKVVTATMAIHNFIRRYNAGDPDFMAYDDNPDLVSEEYLEEYYNIRNHGNNDQEQVQRTATTTAMSTVRDTIRDELVAAGLR